MIIPYWIVSTRTYINKKMPSLIKLRRGSHKIRTGCWVIWTCTYGYIVSWHDDKLTHYILYSLTYIALLHWMKKKTEKQAFFGHVFEFIDFKVSISTYVFTYLYEISWNSLIGSKVFWNWIINEKLFFFINFFDDSYPSVRTLVSQSTCNK